MLRLVARLLNNRLPDRHVPDFFVCDILDAVPKGDMAAMEHPVFSISTKPDRRIRRYESANGEKFIEVTPSVKGLATVHDRDVLIFCISQCMAALNKGQKISRTVRFKAYDLLVATNRPTGGESYHRLKEALDRLGGTRISTNIITGDQEIIKGFGLIESYEIVRETRDGRMQDVEITLADWVFNAIQAEEVLTLHRDYFRLRKPLERRMYELARKHCGKKDEWRISLDLLRKKCGSGSTEKEFRRLISKIVREDKKFGHMPDYAVSLTEGNMIVFHNRGTMPGRQEEKPSVAVRALTPETYHDARTMAPGWDVYELEREWREWLTEPPRNADAAFLGFCKKWIARRSG